MHAASIDCSPRALAVTVVQAVAIVVAVVGSAIAVVHLHAAPTWLKAMAALNPVESLT